MSKVAKSLVDYSGGRFAFMSAAVCEDNELSQGAFRLYAALCGKADKEGHCKLQLKRLAVRFGKTPRTVQKWKLELESKGWIEELHQGDKAIGRFRVIRDPKERGLIRIKNAPKIVERRKVKTTHANRNSHPRCESGFAQNKSKQDSLIFSHDQSLPPSDTDRNNDARQGNLKATRGASQIEIAEAVRSSNDKNNTKVPDWNGWARYLAKSRQISERDAWEWILEEIDRIQKDKFASGLEAGRMLDQRLKIERRFRK